MSSDPSPNGKTALNTWKDIAQFFDRDVRTVQRWEKEEGLPVHRHIHQRKSSVYAYPEELQRWWRERGAIIAEVSAAAPAVVPRRWKLWSAAALAAVIVLAVISLKMYRSSQAPHSPALRVTVLDGTRPNGHLGMPQTGDLNGDGLEDVVLSSGHAREIYLLFGGKPLASAGEMPAVASVVITGANNGWLGATQVGDFNGDGLKDLLITHQLAEPDSYGATGKSFILWGRKQWPASLVLPAAADVTLSLEWSTDTRLQGCAVVGGPPDLNSDGVEDVFLSASEYGFGEEKSTGAIFVLFGKKRWPRELEVSSSAGVRFRGSRTGSGLGSPCVLGDFNGDRRTDLAGYDSETTLWNLLGGRGAISVFEGRAQWPRLLNSASDFTFRMEGTRTNVNCIFPLLADLNGDGLDDLVTGWSGFIGDAHSTGEVRIWFGRAGRSGKVFPDSADVMIAGSKEGSKFGQSLLGRDMDHDGLQDLIVTEPGTGQVYLLYGRRDWKKSTHIGDYSPAVLFRGEIGAGTERMAFADLDGDQMPELIFTSPNANAKGAESGRAWILKPFLTVQVDVRPDREPNVVLWPGTVVARIMGYSINPEDRIDISTMRLAGAPAKQRLEQDFNGDGIPDWQVYFDSAAMKITGATKQVIFSARTQVGLPVAGADAVEVLPQVSSGKPRPAR